MAITNVTTSDHNSFSLRYEEGDVLRPCVVFFHPDPSVGGDINNIAVKTAYSIFYENNFSVIRMNLPEIKTQSKKQKPTIVSHIKIANAAIQWFKDKTSYNGVFWSFGIGYGCRLAMQIVMRNPEIQTFFLVDPYLQFSDIHQFPLDNITGNVIWGDKDPNLSPDYMNILFKYLREKKKLHVNNILVKDSGPLSREESLENLSLILNNFLFHWQNHREIPKFDF